MKISETLFDLIQPIENIVLALQQAGAESFLVGGFVRDLVLGLPTKDIDIEVHGLSLEAVQQVLEQFGQVSLIGKQFGVLRLHKLDVDWSLPRRDSQGRKPTVAIDPHMSFEQAARRRDVTMNAMGISLNDLIAAGVGGQLVIKDPYDGLKAMDHKELAAVDTTLFLEDPLRFFRVMQFIGRFEMVPNQELHELCKTMSLQGIATERIEEEIKKLVLKSHRPSLGFRWLHKLGRLQELFPELHALVGVQQRVDYHPEGDVFEHSMQALDAAAQLEYADDHERWHISLAALCHDFGKPATTDELFRCHGHDEAGVAPTKSFLKRFTRDQELITVVAKLVKFHMRPFLLPTNDAKLSAYKRLAAKLAPDISMQQLALLALADSRGTNAHGPEPLTDDDELVATFLRYAEQAQVMLQAEHPVLQGRDLLDVISPGPKMGALLKKAYEIQLEEGVKDPLVLKQRVLLGLK